MFLNTSFSMGSVHLMLGTKLASKASGGQAGELEKRYLTCGNGVEWWWSLCACSLIPSFTIILFLSSLCWLIRQEFCLKKPLLVLYSKKWSGVHQEMFLFLLSEGMKTQDLQWGLSSKNSVLVCSWKVWLSGLVTVVFFCTGTLEMHLRVVSYGWNSTFASRNTRQLERKEKFQSSVPSVCLCLEISKTGKMSWASSWF